MTDNPQHGGGSLLARIFNRLGRSQVIHGESPDDADTADVPQPDPTPTPTPTPTPEAAAPEPPRREHLYGSAYRVRVSADEVIRARGLGRGVNGYGRTLGSSGSAERSNTASAAAVTGLGPDILRPE